MLPKYDVLAAGHQLSLLKVIAEISPYVKGAACREFLPALFPLLQSLMPAAASADTKLNYTAIECVLYAFHNTASRVPGFLHALCGIKINTGQPENRIDEDFTEKLKDLHARMKVVIAQCDEFIAKLKQVRPALPGMHHGTLPKHATLRTLQSTIPRLCSCIHTSSKPSCTHMYKQAFSVPCTIPQITREKSEGRGVDEAEVRRGEARRGEAELSGKRRHETSIT